MTTAPAPVRRRRRGPRPGAPGPLPAPIPVPPPAAPDAAPPRICFVTGVGRSGTTAMADLLNQHPAVCIGIERYKFKFLRRTDFDGSEFTRERFFDFRTDDTNLLPKGRGHWQEVYEALGSKYPQALVLGDKIPHLFEKFEPCAQAFPQAKWIYMLRDINAVAASWNARAQNPRDKWPQTSDFRAAVPAWNSANALVATLPQAQVKVVHYEAFFGGSTAECRALMEFLELPDSPAFAAAAQASYRKYAEIVKTKPPVLLEGQREHIAEHADMETYAALIARSRPPGLMQEGMRKLRTWLLRRSDG